MARPLKSSAFEVFSEFGPDRVIPRTDRLAAKFPQLTAEEISDWLLDFQKVETKAYELAVENRRRNLKPESTIQRIMAEFSFLDRDAAGIAFNQAMYFSWRDGL